VTTNFGEKVLVEQTVDIQDSTTAMDALMAVADVETKYGGGFVNAINGISSQYESAGGAKNDWFFYINGMASNIGAKEYILSEGDVENWDFRSWGYHQFVPAIIGNFPQPFLSGYRGKVKPTIIVYELWLEEFALSLEEKLSELDVKEVSVQNFDQLTELNRKQNNLILLGSKGNGMISELNKAQKKLGFYTCFHQGNIGVFNDEGEVTAEYSSGCGVIQATQNPWNPRGTGVCENVVWIVSGTDEDGVESAINTLINSGDELRHFCAIVISDGELIKVP